MNNVETRNQIVTALIESFGKALTYSNLAKIVADLTRVQTYAAMAELTATGLVNLVKQEKTVKVNKDETEESVTKIVLAWQIPDEDESKANELWSRYLAA